LIKQIVGSEPEYEPANVFGMRLGVQSLRAVPDFKTSSALPASPQQILLGSGWTDTFRSYIVWPDAHYKGFIPGKLFSLTNEQYELMREWDIAPDWYEEVPVEVNLSRGRTKQAITLGTRAMRLVENNIAEGHITVVENPNNAPIHLNDPSKMYEVARQTTADFLARQKQP
jgi:hypothetical protein